MPVFDPAMKISLSENLANLALFMQQSVMLELLPFLDARKLSQCQFGVLLLLAYESSLTVGALSSRFGMSRSAMSKVLTQMEMAGWLERVKTPLDARKILVQLTRDGAQVVEEARALLAAAILRQHERFNADSVSADKLVGIIALRPADPLVNRPTLSRRGLAHAPTKPTKPARKKGGGKSGKPEK